LFLGLLGIDKAFYDFVSYSIQEGIVMSSVEKRGEVTGGVASIFPEVRKIFQIPPQLKSIFFFHQPYPVGGGQGGGRPGDREKRGQEVYRRREKRGREAGFPRWREAGEKVENYATLRNISQSKKCKGVGAKKYRAGTGIKGYGKREVQTPLSPLPPLSKVITMVKLCFKHKCSYLI